MAELIRRDILAQITPWLAEKEILLLLGSRQVGKTSILRLLQDQVKEAPVFYFDLESTFDLSHPVSPEHFIDYLSSKGYLPSRRAYCFIDEIQYHPDPTKFLKVIHDHHPSVKLIVSGSSSFAIRQKFKDALTGRKQVFHIMPLHFGEFLRLKNHPNQTVKESLRLDVILGDFAAVRKFHTLTPEMLPL